MAFSGVPIIPILPTCLVKSLGWPVIPAKLIITQLACSLLTRTRSVVLQKRSPMQPPFNTSFIHQMLNVSPYPVICMKDRYFLWVVMVLVMLLFMPIRNRITEYCTVIALWSTIKEEYQFTIIPGIGL
ncbi:hypothetical protein D3C85_992560 [compost metagenome]